MMTNIDIFVFETFQVGAAMGGMGSTMTGTMPTNTTLGGMLGGSQQVWTTF